jgi:hypothetical protein
MNKAKQFFLVWLLVLCLGPVIWLSIDPAESQQTASEPVDSSGVTDSVFIPDPDSATSDSSITGDSQSDNNLISKLLIPVVLTGLLGGALLLLFTQRGS